ncbi:MAG: hypothetical protein JST66_14180 [Bacteroidetes bacterium]|nr:hypothetical protein [Bacteroidota bacterium]
MYLLAASGTLRTILLLVILWLLLRIWMRVQAGGPDPRQRTRWSEPDPRRKGEVRIEQAEPRKRAAGPQDVEDADFEEIK